MIFNELKIKLRDKKTIKIIINENKYSYCEKKSEKKSK